MRDDYFTLSECSYMMGISSQTIHEIAEADKEFPLFSVGRRYVIPKDKYFAWYDKACGLGMHGKWKNKQVAIERGIWKRGLA